MLHLLIMLKIAFVVSSMMARLTRRHYPRQINSRLLLIGVNSDNSM